MELKNNEATRNRPMGDRILDAPAVLIHLPQYIQMIKSEKAWQDSDRNAITVFKSDDVSLVVTCLKEGADLDDVQTKGYSTLLILEGKLRSKAGDEEKESEKGDILVFHPAVTYSIHAASESAFLLTHYNSDNKE